MRAISAARDTLAMFAIAARKALFLGCRILPKGSDLPAIACPFFRCVLGRQTPFELHLLKVLAVVTIQGGQLACQVLPARDDDIDVLGIKLQPVADALGQFRSG